MPITPKQAEIAHRQLLIREREDLVRAIDQSLREGDRYIKVPYNHIDYIISRYVDAGWSVAPAPPTTTGYYSGALMFWSAEQS